MRKNLSVLQFQKIFSNKLMSVYMYKFLYSILIIAVLLLHAGCKKFLDTEVVGNYPESEFYQTETQALLAINAAYQPLSFSTFQNRIWVFGDVASDDTEKGGDAGDQPDIGLINDFNINSINGNLEYEWPLLYEGITRCNIVLDKVPAIIMKEELKKRILGEAKFLRAWYYFTLVNIFGDVPIVLTPLNADELQIPQSPVSVIFETVIEPDLKDAATKLLPAYDASNIGRATSGAAKALLTKAYVFQQKWTDAASIAAELIASGQYSLMPVYKQNFDVNFENNAESIFEIQHLSQQDPFTGNVLNQWFAPKAPIDAGYGFNAPTQDFVDEFEMTIDSVYDPRLDYSVGRDGMPWFDGKIFSKNWSPTGYLTKKHQQPLAEIPINLKGNANINYVAIRYADVLLWYAEALNESGNTADALIPLNQVRKRARESYFYDNALPGFGTIPQGLLPDVTNTIQSVVRIAIQHERRVELGLEFHRYFDIIRYGQSYAEQALADKPNFDYTIHKFFPIPQSERDRNHALN